jgi:hypothetical protein
MPTAADFDRLYAEMLANRILLLQMFDRMSEHTDDPGIWTERQRMLALEVVDLSGFNGYHDPEKIKKMTRDAVNFAIDRVYHSSPPHKTLQ